MSLAINSIYMGDAHALLPQIEPNSVAYNSLLLKEA